MFKSKILLPTTLALTLILALSCGGSEATPTPTSTPSATSTPAPTDTPQPSGATPTPTFIPTPTPPQRTQEPPSLTVTPTSSVVMVTPSPTPTVTPPPTSVTQAEATATPTQILPTSRPNRTVPPTPTRPPAQVNRLEVILPPSGYDANVPWHGGLTGLLDKRPALEFLIGVSRSDGTLQPELATRWEIAPDGMSWRFELREGVVFHDGWGQWTARDVVHTAWAVRRDDSILAEALTMAVTAGRAWSFIRSRQPIRDYRRARDHLSHFAASRRVGPRRVGERGHGTDEQGILGCGRSQRVQCRDHRHRTVPVRREEDRRVCPIRTGRQPLAQDTRFQGAEDIDAGWPPWWQVRRMLQTFPATFVARRPSMDSR